MTTCPLLKRTFPSSQLNGYANIIGPTSKTRATMQKSNRFNDTTVSGLVYGEV